MTDDEFGGRAAMDSRLQDLVLRCIADDPTWARTTVGLANDLTSDDQVSEMLSSVCTVICNMAIRLYGGRREAIDRFTADLAQLRAIAAKGATE